MERLTKLEAAHKILNQKYTELTQQIQLNLTNTHSNSTN